MPGRRRPNCVAQILKHLSPVYPDLDLDEDPDWLPARLHARGSPGSRGGFVALGVPKFGFAAIPEGSGTVVTVAGGVAATKVAFSVANGYDADLCLASERADVAVSVIGLTPRRCRSGPSRGRRVSLAKGCIP